MQFSEKRGGIMYIVNEFVEKINKLNKKDFNNYLKENFIVILGNIYYDKMNKIYKNKYNNDLEKVIENMFV